MKVAVKMKKALAVTTAVAMLSTMPIATMAKDYGNHWAKNVIAEWSQYGIVAGYEDGSFKPNNNVTNAELAAFITRVLGLQDNKSNVKYSDVAVDAWYADPIAKVTAAGIMKGTNGKFNPNKPATREETAAALAIAYHMASSGSTSFADDSAIAEWAKEGVSALAQNGYIAGRPNGKFDPKANLTRAEFLSMLDKLTDAFLYQAGTYNGTKKGNVLVNTKDVNLEDMTVAGNLYLAPGIGTGDVSLNNVTVKGQVFVSGGGVDSIKLRNCVLPNGAVITSRKPVRVVNDGGKVSIKAKEGTHVILTGTFDQVEVPAGVVLELRGATVERIIIVPSKSNPNAKAEIKTDDKSVIKVLEANAAVNVTGKGKLIELIANVSGIKTEMTPEKITVKDGVDKPVTGNSGSGGGGGGGGGGGTGGGDNGGGVVTPVKPSINISKATLYRGTAEAWSGTVTNNTIVISESLLNSRTQPEADGIALTLSNVEADKTVTLNYANLFVSGSKDFKANKTYSLIQFLGFAELNAEAMTNKVVDQLAPVLGGRVKAAQYIEGKLDELGITPDLEVLADGEVNIGTAIRLINELHATYASTPEQQAFLALILDAMGVKVQGNDYVIEATLKAAGYEDTKVTIKITK